MTIGNVVVNVGVKFGDSRSNGFRDIRGTDFVSNERANEHGETHANSAKRLFRLKTATDRPYVNEEQKGTHGRATE